MSRKTCIVVAGPTAVGKTALAIKLAAHFQTAIISADSRQCYRELNIGVAKPSPEQLASVHHYFVNSHSIFEEVNAAAFETYALQAIEEIFSSGDYAIMVGGTGLYIKAFCEGIDPIPAIPPVIRNAIISDYNQYGISWLQEQVRTSDPVFYQTAETLNPQRMMRALEVIRATGNSISSFYSSNKKERSFNFIKIGLELPREKLYTQIDQRVDDMINAGLVEEVKKLLPYEKLNALQTVGYKEVFDFLKGITNADATVEMVKRNTRHYAKRQLTWFKKDDAISWFAPTDFNTMLSFINARISTS